MGAWPPARAGAASGASGGKSFPTGNRHFQHPTSCSAASQPYHFCKLQLRHGPVETGKTAHAALGAAGADPGADAGVSSLSWVVRRAVSAEAAGTLRRLAHTPSQLLDPAAVAHAVTRELWRAAHDSLRSPLDTRADRRKPRLVAPSKATQVSHQQSHWSAPPTSVLLVHKECSDEVKNAVGDILAYFRDTYPGVRMLVEGHTARDHPEFDVVVVGEYSEDEGRRGSKG